MKDKNRGFSRFTDEYKLELIGGGLLLVVTTLLGFFKAPEEAIWSLGVMSVILPLAVGALKAHISTNLSSITHQWNETYGRATRLHWAVTGLTGLKLEYANRIVARATSDVERARDGLVPLDPAMYYHSIIDNMREAKSGSEVYAVNCISLLRWRDDPRQLRYFNENNAAADRGVKINRICIIDGSILSGPDAPKAKSILRELVKHPKIVIQVVYLEHLAQLSQLVRDWVLFMNPEQQLFIDYPDPFDGTRVSRAELVLDNEMFQKYLDDFRLLSEYALTEDEIIRQLADDSPQPKIELAGKRPHPRISKPINLMAGRSIVAAEPIFSMTQQELPIPVVSCEEAATAKNIPLENELKTLILTTGHGFIALEIPGDAHADLRAVKKALATNEAFLASDQELSFLGLQAGAVCAVRDPVWSMTHLVSRRLLTLEYVSTNAGSRTRYIKFKPALLLDAKFTLQGDFERVS